MSQAFRTEVIFEVLTDPAILVLGVSRFRPASFTNATLEGRHWSCCQLLFTEDTAVTRYLAAQVGRG